MERNRIMIALPEKWSGKVKDRVRQIANLQAAAWEEKTANHLNKSDYKDLRDAILQAIVDVYGMEGI